MRCRKVRSYLSAYSSDELAGPTRAAVAQHLSACASCRKDEAAHRAVRKGLTEIGSNRTSGDFNTRLLNRLAQERFSETRSKAYLPRPVPLVQWNRVVPALTAVTTLLIAVVAFWPGQDQSPIISRPAASTNNDYLTAEPVNNPNLTVSLDKDWSFDRQMARMERVSRIASNMTQMNRYDVVDYTSSLRQVSASVTPQGPFVDSYYRMRPVHRIYIVPHQQQSAQEVRGTY